MLQVADSGPFSVERTESGGFSAQPRALERENKTTRAALRSLKFTNPRPRKYKDYPDPVPTRDDYEYGDDSIVDVIGLENRTASETNKKSHWSSRYSIDNTMLGISGGSMRAAERASRKNLLGKTPQVFGSGFKFRQAHVFGKQNVTMSTENLHSYYRPDAKDDAASPTIKSWQEQLAQKRLQQRRILFAVTVFLAVFFVASISTVTVHRKALAAAAAPHVSFSVIGDGPFTIEEAEKLKTDLAQVTSDFVVHIGDLQDADDTGCDYAHTRDVANLLEDNSPHVVFVVPGEDDWNNCENPGEAWDVWYNNFRFFDKRWEDVEEYDLTVYRQKSQLENWGFVKSGVLFLGVHAVNGNVVREREFADRNLHNYRWVMGMATEHHDTIRAVVVFGNAVPGDDITDPFFEDLGAFWKNYDKPLLYVHSSNGIEPNVFYTPMDEVENFYGFPTDAFAFGKPVGITVGFDTNNPFKIQADE